MQVLTVLCNIAAQGPACCQQLHQQSALPLLLPALALPDPVAVGQCLELLHLLFLHWPQVGAGSASESTPSQHCSGGCQASPLSQAAADFVRQGGHQALAQHQSTPELQERARALLDMVGQYREASTFSPCHTNSS